MFFALIIVAAWGGVLALSPMAFAQQHFVPAVAVDRAPQSQLRTGADGQMRALWRINRCRWDSPLRHPVSRSECANGA
jgi:hypothetical protein